MMGDLPKFVEFHEEGPREGFQIEKRTYPLEQRVALIHALADTGLRQIQVASFVNPRAVPTMADSAELFAALKKRPNVRYTGLWLNDKGFEQARQAENIDLDGNLMLYVSDPFCQKNNNCSASEMQLRQISWLDKYLALKLPVSKAYITTAFGCNLAGDIPLSRVVSQVHWVIGLCQDRNIELPALCLADTMGWANPSQIQKTISAVRELAPDARIGLHLHDTRGLGAANVLAALQLGVDLFDASVAGLGGCPFAGHKNELGAGNVCTEDLVFMCHEIGIETGIDLEKLISASQLAEEILCRRLQGKVMHAGSLQNYQ